MSGRQVTFIGDAMAAVVQGVEEVRTLIGQPPVVVGVLATRVGTRREAGLRSVLTGEHKCFYIITTVLIINICLWTLCDG